METLSFVAFPFGIFINLALIVGSFVEQESIQVPPSAPWWASIVIGLASGAFGVAQTYVRFKREDNALERAHQIQVATDTRTHELEMNKVKIEGEKVTATAIDNNTETLLQMVREVAYLSGKENRPT